MGGIKPMKPLFEPANVRPAPSSSVEHPLNRADPGWLGTLRLGVLLKFWLVVLAVVWLIGLAAAHGLLKGNQWLESAVWRGLSSSGTVLLTVLMAYSVFLITTRESGGPATWNGARLRPAARSLAVILVAVGLSQTVAYVHAGPGYAGRNALQLANVTIAALVAFGELVFLRRFALRIPDLALARVIVVATCIYAIANVAITLLANLWTVAPGPVHLQHRPPLAVLMLAMCGLVVAGIGGIVWWMVLMLRFARACRQAAATPCGDEKRSSQPA